LGYGKFNWQATVNTMRVLEIMALAMIFQSINYYLLKVFFAKKDAKRPFFASLISYLLGLAICFYLGLNFKIQGLALGILSTYALYSFVLFFLLRVHLNISLKTKKDFIKSLFKIIIVSLLSSLIGYLSLNSLKQIYSFSKVKNLVFVSGVSLVLTLFVFFILSRLLKIEEIKEVLGYFQKRFIKTKDVPN
jgi:peptidoglycan biosynthesis protein MviN/MurJ (putative lipid II flippase)